MIARPPLPSPHVRPIGVAALVAATFLMVAGGPYGIEALVQKTGFGMAIVLLIVTPLVWSLPTSLMVGELAAALPMDGGYYAWVKRALGPFWGFQEAWLSITASVFDMGIYPALFVAYAARLWPSIGDPHVALGVRAAVLASCLAWNLRGAKAIGSASEAISLVVLAPFVVFALLAFARGSSSHGAPLASGDVMGGVMVAMWNTMGWDNASTLASEVKRPQRTYPLAMVSAVILVSVVYVLPVGAAWAAHVDIGTLSTGGWADAAGAVGGRALELAVVAGGMVTAVGMLLALSLSYSRVPMALAEDGLLPAALARRSARGVPAGSLLVCGVFFSLSLALSFERLVLLDILLYGLSLVLEFVALVVLRVREPALARPFRVPFGVLGCVAAAIGPTALLVVAFVRNFDERVGPMRSLSLALVIIALGPLAYVALRALRALRRSALPGAVAVRKCER